MNGEDVFGRKISLQKSNYSDGTFQKCPDLPKRPSFPPPPNPAKVAPPTLLTFPKKPGNLGTPFNSTGNSFSNVSSGNYRQFYRPSCSGQNKAKSFTGRQPSESENGRVVSESSEDEHHRRELNSSDEGNLIALQNLKKLDHR